MAIHEPEALAKALEIEDTYRATLTEKDGKTYSKSGRETKVLGLWGQGRQGKRKGSSYRPAAWRRFAEEHGLLDPEVLRRLQLSGMYDAYPDIETNRCFASE